VAAVLHHALVAHAVDSPRIQRCEKTDCERKKGERGSKNTPTKISEWISFGPLSTGRQTVIYGIQSLRVKSFGRERERGERGERADEERTKDYENERWSALSLLSL
jgi:hypothetical protein